MKKIFVAGHAGMVGGAICRALRRKGEDDVLTEERGKLDLLDSSSVDRFLRVNKPDAIVIAAAKVGGIFANDTFPADFIQKNLMIQTNVIMHAHKHEVPKLLFLGSSCIYPRDCPQPMREDALLSGRLEPTNEPYAIAKIAGIKLCESVNRQFGRDYRSVMPTNLYGPGDNYHPTQSHVVPALIRRFHEAKLAGENIVTVWGTGTARREFLHVDDLAEASLFILGLEKSTYQSVTTPQASHINIGFGEDISIRELAHKVKDVVGFEGEIRFDTTKPDGAPRKLLDSSIIKGLGWSPKVGLQSGLRRTYENFVESNRGSSADV